MEYQIKEESNFKYIESNGPGDNILLLHGLFGALSNFHGIIKHFSSNYNVVVPILPIFEMPIREVSLEGLLNHVNAFVQFKEYKQVHVMGNSLGGHLALLYALLDPSMISSVALTGSSGLFESGMGSTFPKRGDYDYIKKKTGETFYDPNVATKELVDEVFDIVNDRNKAIRIIYTARSAIKHNLGDKLHQIKAPTLLIWGKQDIITPPFVGEKFHELIEHSSLHLMDKCGHAPMMERPEEFNKLFEDFLTENSAS